MVQLISSLAVSLVETLQLHGHIYEQQEDSEVHIVLLHFVFLLSDSGKLENAAQTTCRHFFFSTVLVPLIPPIKHAFLLRNMFNFTFQFIQSVFDDHIIIFRAHGVNQYFHVWSQTTEYFCYLYMSCIYNLQKINPNHFMSFYSAPLTFIDLFCAIGLLQAFSAVLNVVWMQIQVQR